MNDLIKQLSIYNSESSLTILSKEYDVFIPTIYNWNNLYKEHESPDDETMTT